MRILFLSHVPLNAAEPGDAGGAVVAALTAAGHQIRAVVVDDRDDRGGPRDSAVRVVPFRAAHNEADPTAAGVPRLHANTGQRSFSGLSDDELTAYRQGFREALDEEIAHFDPQIIHAEHAWLPAHLALESGVPYVITAHELELNEAAQQVRYARLVAEAIENAGRVLVTDETLVDRLRGDFGDLEGRLILAPWLANASADTAATFIAPLVGVYSDALDDRLGRRWRA